jgi:DNA polymerase-3 subunit gamma/tau
MSRPKQNGKAPARNGANARGHGALPNHASGTPLHIQVRETIRRQVREGELIDDSGQLMTEAELGKHFGTPVRVTCDIGAARATAAAVDAEQRAQRQRDAEDAIAANPFVQALVRDFAAQVVPGSIQPHTH